MRVSCMNGCLWLGLLQVVWASAGYAQAAPMGEAPEPPSSEAPSAAVQADYREIVERAVVEFDAGRFAEARAFFLRGHELWPSARTYRVLGMTSFELRHYALALQELEAAISDTRRALGDEQRTEVMRLIEQARGFVGRYRVHVSPPDAQLMVDGEVTSLPSDGTLRLEVGSHELLLRAEGHGELRRRLIVDGGEDEAVSIELTPLTPMAAAIAPAPAASAEPPRKTMRSSPADDGFELWPWTLGGGVLTGGAALVFFLRADAKAECAPDCSDAEVSSINTHDAIAAISGTVSAALLITTVVALLWSGDSEPPADALALGVGPGYVVGSVQF
jgi:hypothetical protein